MMKRVAEKGRSTSDESALDERIREAASRLVTDVVRPEDIAYIANRDPRLGRLISAPALVVGAIAFIALVSLLRISGGFDSAGRGGVGIPINDKRLSPQFVDGVLRLVLSDRQSDGTTVLAEGIVGAEKFRVGQVVCPSDSDFGRKVVLLGHVPSRPAVTPTIRVTGLARGETVSSADGSFVFLAETIPDPGTEWTASTDGYPSVHAYVAFYGVLQSSPEPVSSECIFHEGSIEVLGP